MRSQIIQRSPCIRVERGDRCHARIFIPPHAANVVIRHHHARPLEAMVNFRCCDHESMSRQPLDRPADEGAINWNISE